MNNINITDKREDNKTSWLFKEVRDVESQRTALLRKAGGMTIHLLRAT